MLGVTGGFDSQHRFSGRVFTLNGPPAVGFGAGEVTPHAERCLRERRWGRSPLGAPAPTDRTSGEDQSANVLEPEGVIGFALRALDTACGEAAPVFDPQLGTASAVLAGVLHHLVS